MVLALHFVGVGCALDDDKRRNSATSDDTERRIVVERRVNKDNLRVKMKFNNGS